MNRFLYHIAHPRNLQNILKLGLMSDSEGYIYLFKKRRVGTTIKAAAFDIAKYHKNYSDFVLLKIDVQGILRSAERTTYTVAKVRSGVIKVNEVIVWQPKIHQKYISLVKDK